MSEKNGKHVRPSGSVWFGTMSAQWEYVTPQVAEEWLEKNVDNRHPITALTERYARDMTLGYWQEAVPFGIAFDDEGILIDSQHRLKAVVLSGKSYWFLVFRNVPNTARLVIDRNKVRNQAHCLQILGLQSIDNLYVAIVRRMAMGTAANWKTMSETALMEFISLNHDAIVYAKEAIPQSGGPPASVRGAIARAFYHIDKDILDRFCRVLSTGDDEGPASRTVRTLRDLLLRGRARTNSVASNSSLYLRAENCIQVFASGVEISRLYEAPRELFPLPADRMPEDGAAGDGSDSAPAQEPRHA